MVSYSASGQVLIESLFLTLLFLTLLLLLSQQTQNSKDLIQKHYPQHVQFHHESIRGVLRHYGESKYDKNNQKSFSK